MGELTKKGESRPVTQDELALHPQARALQAQHRVPVLQHADNPYEYLFFALFDGTGQDADNPKQLPTNVGVLKEQIYELNLDPSLRIAGHYVKGIGTQANPLARWPDQYRPFTWDEKIEEAYRALAEQTRKWQQQDPQAQVRIAEVGYSRGAVLAVGLAQLVDKYGIADPENLQFGRDANGNITVQSPRPPLMAPGQVAQAVGLLDPVATNMPGDYDARPAPSVISGYAPLAANEQRVSFKHQAILDAELTADGRFLRVPMPGGHSNVGGGNQAPGLEAMAFNSLADYLNGLRDKPLFTYRPLPDDPALYTVYQARGLTAVPGLDRDGLRDLREDLANCKIVDPCRDAEPMNQALAAQFEYRYLQPAAPVPAFIQSQQEAMQVSAAPTATHVSPLPAKKNDVAFVEPEQASPQVATPQPGDQVRQVADLQAGLIQLGYHRAISQPLQVNGVNDDATRQAVTAFQARNDLPMTSTFDQATRQALQQMLLAQQQAAEQRQAEDKAREKEQAEKEQTRADAQVSVSHSNHPQHALYADMEQRFQGKGHSLSEAQLSALTLQMYAAGATPGWHGDVAVRNGEAAYVRAVWPPTMRAHLDLQAPAPSLQETMQAFTQQQALEQTFSRGPDGPERNGPARSM